MPDDLTKKGKPDRERVNHNQKWEMDYQKKKQEEKKEKSRKAD